MYWGLKWTFSSFCFRVCLTCLATRHLQHRYLYAWQLIVLEKALIYSAWTLNGTCCWRQAKISFAQTSKDDSWLYVRTVKDRNGREKDEMTIIVMKKRIIWVNSSGFCAWCQAHITQRFTLEKLKVSPGAAEPG